MLILLLHCSKMIHIFPNNNYSLKKLSDSKIMLLWPMMVNIQHLEAEFIDCLLVVLRYFPLTSLIMKLRLDAFFQMWPRFIEFFIIFILREYLWGSAFSKKNCIIS